MQAQHVANSAPLHKSTLEAGKTQAGLTTAPLSCHFTEGTVYFGETIKESGPGGICTQPHKHACLDEFFFCFGSEHTFSAQKMPCGIYT